VTTLQETSIVAAPLDEVWRLYSDPIRGLPAVSGPDLRVHVEHADLPLHEGSRVVLDARWRSGPTTRWVSRIEAWSPPEPGATTAWFVDELERGPFTVWRHQHWFERLDDRRTRLVDRVRYEVGWGPLGWVADHVLVRRALVRSLRQRHERTRELLEDRRRPAAAR
jgi:ligand-binding SRPBCC domain-containing protein